VGNNSSIKTTHKTTHATSPGHVIKSSRLPPRFSVEEPGYEAKACVVEVTNGIRRDVRTILTLSGFQCINVESALHYC